MKLFKKTWTVWFVNLLVSLICCVAYTINYSVYMLSLATLPILVATVVTYYVHKLYKSIGE
ncbi:hypothetical protein ACQUY5_31970 [Bacillus cereus]|uniref:hypothetical protein n=1 Tax=Bacillus cereus TaxID=1396 RepID=UPI003D17B3C1